MKILLSILLNLLILNTIIAQNFVIEVKGKVTKNGLSLKKGDQIGNKQKLVFEPNAEIRLLTTKGDFWFSGNNPKSSILELDALIKETMLTTGNQSTRGFGELTNAQIEGDLANLISLLKIDKNNFDENFHQYIEPYLQTRYSATENSRVIDILQNKFNLTIPRTLGALRDETRYQQAPQAARLVTRSYTSLPSSYSIKQYCPIPKNQSFSDCVGWSTTYAARTILYAIQNKLTNKQLITSETFAPSFTYSQIKLNPADAVCNKGTYIESAMKLLKKQGAVKYDEFEYACSPRIDNESVTKASNYKIKEYKRLSDGYNADKRLMAEAIKKSLTENKPVVIAIEVYDSFHLNAKNSYAKTEVWNGVKDKMTGAHAITVVGYDDSKFGGAFELMNSWGTFWGNGGFLWVKYNDFADITYEAYEMSGNDMNAPEPQPNVLGKTDFAGSFRIVLADGTEMPVQVNNSISDFNNSVVEKSTYTVTKPYSSGTQFRINFTNNQPAYVYLISYGTSTKNVNSIFPFQGFSAYLDYKRNEVAIPNEEYLIQMDDNIGTDYLCILYAKEELDIRSISQQMQAKSGGFNSKLKAVLKDKLVDGTNIKFQTNKVNFEAKSQGKTVLPIVIEVKHTN